MEFKVKEQVIIKLFVGFLVDPSMRHELSRSPAWRQAQLTPEHELIKIPYQGQEYIGIYLGSLGITLDKLRLIEDEVHNKMMEYCPEYNLSNKPLKIFSQVFIR